MASEFTYNFSLSRVSLPIRRNESPKIMHFATSQRGLVLRETASSFCGVVEFADDHSWSAGSSAACAPPVTCPSMPPTSPSATSGGVRDRVTPFQNAEHRLKV